MAKLIIKNTDLRTLCETLQERGIEIYKVYEEDLSRPHVHIKPESIEKKAFVDLVTCIGMYNFLSKYWWGLIPCNHGDYESLLSLQPLTRCGKKDLKIFCEQTKHLLLCQPQ